MWLESATKRLAILSKLPELCQSDVRESNLMIRKKVEEETTRQKLLRSSRETCLPCNGTWPYCDCGGNKPVNATPVLNFNHVVRTKDEAMGPADYTLPRKDAIDEHWDHGKPRKIAGTFCTEHKECTSDSCVRTTGTFRSLDTSICCHEQLRHCSGHGACVQEGTACNCDMDFEGDDCSKVTVKKQEEKKRKSLNEEMGQFGSLLGNLDDESWMDEK